MIEEFMFKMTLLYYAILNRGRGSGNGRGRGLVTAEVAPQVNREVSNLEPAQPTPLVVDLIFLIMAAIMIEMRAWMVRQ